VGCQGPHFSGGQYQRQLSSGGGGRRDAPDLDRIEKVGNKSAVLLQKIVLKATGEVAADALITFVISDRSGRAVVLEGEVLKQIQRIAPKA
jgi:hypothetical protein